MIRQDLRQTPVPHGLSCRNPFLLYMMDNQNRRKSYVADISNFGPPESYIASLPSLSSMDLEPSIIIVDENDPNSRNVDVPAPKDTKKARKAKKTTEDKSTSVIPWKDPAMKKILVGLVYRHRAYMPTTTSYTQKFEAIAYDLMTNYPPFKVFDKIEGKALNKQFKRYKDSLSTKLALNDEGANLSAIDGLSETDKLLYKMLSQTKEAPGDEEDDSKTAFTKAKLQGVLATKTSQLMKHHLSSSIDDVEPRPKRQKHTKDGSIDNAPSVQLNDSGETISTIESPEENDELQNDEFADRVARVAARICPPEVIAAKMEAAKKSEELQQAQADELTTLNSNTCELKNAVNGMAGKLDKLADAMTAFMQFQVASAQAKN